MNQHLISEVYLKQFGYKDKNAQWKICILEKSKFPLMLKNNKKWLSHKSIGSFLSEVNYFDFENTDNHQFARLIEDANAQVETFLPSITEELLSDLCLSLKGEAILAHYVTNLYVRTSNFDLLLDNLIELGAHKRFLEECLMFETDTEFLSEILKSEAFRSNKNLKNLSRFLFWNYFLKRLADFEYYIIRPFEGKGWLSSDNPVILKNHVDQDTLISFNTEIIFPFSNSVLLLFKMPQSEKASEIFENTILKGVTAASSEVTDKVNNIISDNAKDFVIIPDMEGVHRF